MREAAIFCADDIYCTSTLSKWFTSLYNVRIIMSLSTKDAGESRETQQTEAAEGEGSNRRQGRQHPALQILLCHLWIVLKLSVSL